MHNIQLKTILITSVNLKLKLCYADDAFSWLHFVAFSFHPMQKQSLTKKRLFLNR